MNLVQNDDIQNTLVSAEERSFREGVKKVQNRPVNLFTAMMSIQKHLLKYKIETLKPFSSFSHWHVKGLSSKHFALKVDVLYDWNIYCLQVRQCIFQPGHFTGWGSDGLRPLM